MITYSENQVDIFNHPARIIIAGSSNSGKSEMTTKLIRKYCDKFDSILICGISNHILENDSNISRKLTVSEEILNPFENVDEYSKGLLYVLDDCFLEATQNKNVVDAFTKGRHKNISTIFITQNLFFPGKHARNISLNCSHYILFRNRDRVQIETLGRQLYGKGKASEFSEIYKKAISINSYGYLLVDLAVSTPEALQLRTNIVGESPCEIVFQW